MSGRTPPTSLDGPSTHAREARPEIDRRNFLALLGLGAGTLAVAGATGLTWRAVDGGVFSTGTGPAYAAWDAVVPAGGGPSAMVRAAILAANAHNTQPWRFAVTADRVDLFADTSRNIGTMDPLHREMDISLGCALENLVLAGPSIGRTATVSLLPDTADPTHIARLDLAPSGATPSSLFAAIARRHTNRGPYELGRAVPGEQLDDLSALVDAPDTELVWLTSADDKRTFGDLTLRATRAILADAQQTADDYAWFRTDWKEIQSKKDGITIDPSGQTPVIRAVSKILPVSRQQNNDGWLSGMRDIQIPTAAGFGVLMVRDPLDRRQRLGVGRIWQRMHLAATQRSLGMQPLCQIPERIDREQSAGLPADFATAVAPLLPAGSHPIMTFRIGYPTTDALRSPRRPARDVVLA